MSGWAFYNAVRDAMRRMADADRDKPKAGTDPPHPAPEAKR